MYEWICCIVEQYIYDTGAMSTHLLQTRNDRCQYVIGGFASPNLQDKKPPNNFWSMEPTSTYSLFIALHKMTLYFQNAFVKSDAVFRNKWTWIEISSSQLRLVWPVCGWPYHRCLECSASLLDNGSLVLGQIITVMESELQKVLQAGNVRVPQQGIICQLFFLSLQFCIRIYYIFETTTNQLFIFPLNKDLIWDSLQKPSICLYDSDFLFKRNILCRCCSVANICISNSLSLCFLA